MLRKLTVSASCIAAIAAAPALASEGGTTFYLLGSGGPGAAVAPPLEGVYFDNTLYSYGGDASASREFVVGGQVVAGLDAVVVADFATALVVPSTDFAGGTLSLGFTLPIAHPDIDVSAVLTGPGGQTTSFSRSDEAYLIGDPVLLVSNTWALSSNTFIQPSVQVNIPVGHYREDQLANLSFNRWIVDTSLAMSMHDTESGWDISGKVGYTFDGTNDYTEYSSGDQFHAEAAIEKTLSPEGSIGAQFYYLNQVEADSGPGARLGPFKGEVMAAGVTAAYNFLLGATPVTMRVRLFEEFDVKNRLDGQAFFFSLTFPLSVKLPPGAGG